MTWAATHGAAADGRCTFSVVVPTCGRPKPLTRCLDSIRRLDYPRERFEVIVVDDGSPGDMRTVVEPMRDGMTLRLVRQENGGPAMARNTGARHAKGQFIAFTDDDCCVGVSWLTVLERAIGRQPDCLIGGSVMNTLGHNACAVTSQVILDAVFAFYNENPETVRCLTSSNMAMPADTFRRLGGFDEGFSRAGAEDRDLCDRWRHAGYPLCHAPAAVVGHAHDMNIRGFVRQHFHYGRGAWQYHQRRAARSSGRLREDMQFHRQLPQLLRGRLRQYSLLERVNILALLGVWQIANAAGFFAEQVVGRRQSSRRPAIGGTQEPARGCAVTSQEDRGDPVL